MLGSGGVGAPLLALEVRQEAVEDLVQRRLRGSEVEAHMAVAVGAELGAFRHGHPGFLQQPGCRGFPQFAGRHVQPCQERGVGPVEDDLGHLGR